MITIAFLIMQFIISAKAGLVNAIEGTANVQVQEQVPVGKIIRTGPADRVEILLNPGSFLRIGENSQAVLDSTELTDIAIRILTGSAIIESNNLDKDSPIRVTNGSLTVLIVAPGVYRFSDNTAAVVDGELRTEDSSTHADQGWELKADGDQYEKLKIPAEQKTLLDQWNSERSRQIASTNARSSDTDSASNIQTVPRSGFLYPGNVPYAFPPGIVPPAAPFSFFRWYNGGYSFFQPLVPRPPALMYPPFYPGFSRPVQPLYLGPRPPATTPVRPAPHPIPSRPGGFRGRR
jgi:hypothetical protein